MKKLIVYILILFFPFIAVAEDQDEFKKAFESALEFLKTNEYEKALELYLWIDENANETEMAYGAVKLPAYYYWGSLASRYPKAMKIFKEVRDEKTSNLKSGQYSEKLFTDISFINTSFGESYKTVKLFEYLDHSNPEFAKLVYKTVESDLLKHKRYQLSRKYLDDSLKRLNDSIDQHIRLIEIDESIRQRIEPVLIDEVIRIITILDECDERSLALEIIDRALEVLNDNEIQNLLK